jgi:thiamine-phosphate pyrophosphorylase
MSKSSKPIKFTGFYFITDSKLSKNGILRDVEDAIKGGATIIQYREKEKDTGPMVEEARALKRICEGRATLLINDRVDVCLAVDADGVHLGQSDMTYGDAYKLLSNKIIGVTVHNVDEAVDAMKKGADYLGVSPIFHTDTKEDAGPASGLKLLEEVSGCVDLPIVAIGGIKLDNVRSVINAGAVTVCAMSATIGENTEERVRQFTQLL